MTDEPAVFHVAMRGCPISESLGVLGLKWALVLLRDVAYFQRHRFNDFLSGNETLTPRVLSRRLKDLVGEGLLERREGPRPRDITYRLTPKGRDAIPILAAFFQYGAKHHAKAVFIDRRPHPLAEVFPGQPAFNLPKGL